MGKERKNVIVEFKDGKNSFRIVEIEDISYNLDDLKGDSFNPKHNPEIDPDELKRQEKSFEKEVNEDGVFGYVLEQWNPSVGVGWENKDSCWGFVGRYDEKTNNHYIVEEFRNFNGRQTSKSRNRKRSK